MIEEARGNLLEADVEALVNTVNTVGVMGKGIGGLDWADVYTVIRNKLSDLSDVRVVVYPPQGARTRQRS